MQISSDIKCFNGRQIQAKHASELCNCEMTFSIYLPPQAEYEKVPVLYWYSGLTCTDQNFVTKAGAQRYAAELGLAIVCPDTSPRGDDVADDPDGSYDFGLGAGFYVNATQAPWARHYQMHDYVACELPALVSSEFAIDDSRVALSGHSMGGHGALTVALKNPARYSSVSAFAPIVAPSQVPWGEKALSGYLGEDRSDWRQYDTLELLKEASQPLPTLVDQGDADNFLQEQLKTELLIQTSNEVGYEMKIRMQPGYDHSYFFIASFIESHLAFHASHLFR